VSRLLHTMLLATAFAGAPTAASAETDGSIEVGVVIAPLAECANGCVTPGDLAQTGSDPFQSVAIALLLVALGIATAMGARTRSRRAPDRVVSGRDR